MRCQSVQLVPSDADILQGPRHAQLADHGVEDIAQIGRLGVNSILLKYPCYNGVACQELVDTLLTGHICAFCRIELADGR